MSNDDLWEDGFPILKRKPLNLYKIRDIIDECIKKRNTMLFDELVLSIVRAAEKEHGII